MSGVPVTSVIWFVLAMSWSIFIFNAADDLSSAELMVLLICPLVNFCFKLLLLIQFLFDHSEFVTGETSHIVPPCNKAGISNFCLEFQKLQKFQISSKRYSSFSSYSMILKFLLKKLGIQCHPVTKPEIRFSA